MRPMKIFHLMVVVATLLFPSVSWRDAAGKPATIPSLAETTGSIWYVKPGGASGDCSTWSNACDLQTALATSTAGDEIWVAAGLYYPGTTRESAYQLKSGVKIFGGFAGDETAREQRDWQSHFTVLSGDIDRNDITDPQGVVTDTGNIIGSNAHHVVTSILVTETAILDGFTITAGNADGNTSLLKFGGGMYNQYSKPTLTNLIFSGNRAVWGGGMHNFSSTPTMTDILFSKNSATAGGGGMYVYSFETAADLILTNVTFFANMAANQGGGIDFSNGRGGMRLDHVTFAANTAAKGGGMYNSAGTVALTNVTFSGNSAQQDGGGLYNSNGSSTLTNVTFNKNTAIANGGGMYNLHGEITATALKFFVNSAFYAGGGMFNDSSEPTLTDVTFFWNDASIAGGGMANHLSNPTLNNIIFYENRAAWGAGMENDSSNPTLVNVTFSSNSAAYNGGGISNNASSPNLTNVTFYANYAGGGGGIHNYGFSNPIITNTILWGNTTDQIFNEQSTPVVTYSDVQGGYAGVGNISDDPRLRPLIETGFTWMHLLPPGSPAIDRGNPDLATCPQTDQRGVTRPVDGDGDGQARCDMGAVEALPPLAYLVLLLR